MYFIYQSSVSLGCLGPERKLRPEISKSDPDNKILIIRSSLLETKYKWSQWKFYNNGGNLPEKWKIFQEWILWLGRI